jgi:hypothetical protein
MSEKDKIYGDLIATRKKHETAEADTARWKLSYDRVSNEKEHIQALESQAQEEIKKYKDLVNEQIQINKTLKARIEDEQKKSNHVKVNYFIR